MLKNYFTIGWRNMVRTKAYSVINLSGLSIGMAAAILIGLWITDEVNYNRSFVYHDRLAQVYHNVTFGDEILTINDVPAPFGEELKNNYADFEEVIITSWPAEHLVGWNESIISATGLFVEPPFAGMFSLEMLQGTSVLVDIHSVMISETLASSLFSDSPIGKVIKLDNRDLFTVSGVFQDFPNNSHFAEVKMLLPLEYYFNLNESHSKKKESWEDYSFQCFVLLKPQASFEQVAPKIRSVLYEKASNDGKALKPDGFLFPMAKWHLYSQFKDGVNVGGPIRFLWMFSIIGGFVLLLACINFMTLATARSEKRSREVGVRKVMGSGRRQLMVQFLSESLLMVSIAFFLAVFLAVICLPWLNELTGKKMVIPWTDSSFILATLAFIFITGLLAGSYPAFYLSSFSAVKSLKGSFKAGYFATLPRKVMVVFQFTISIILTASTLVVFLQIQHAKERPAGFDREGIIYLKIRTPDLAKADYNSLRNELLNSGAVENMAVSDFPITGTMSANASLRWEGKDPSLRPLVAMNSCSHDFPSANGFQFIEGRDFSRELSSDSSAVIVNELAARLISEDDVIGKKIIFGYETEREIIGVIKDQVRWTPFAKQSPHLYFINYAAAGYLTIRLDPRLGTHEALRRIESVIRRFDPGAPFDYKFVDEDYARQFSAEEQVGKLATLFAILAIAISCIGAFGLSAFAASQRTKEIGIRKVLGASVFKLWAMLSTNFAQLVMVAILLGVPLAYYVTSQWLAQYEYRVKVPWVVFALTGIVALLVTLVAVSYEALKAATMNPVKSLRAD